MIVFMVTFVCQMCGDCFDDYESKKRQFCSRKCQYDYHTLQGTVEIKCVQCGSTFRRRKSNVEFHVRLGQQNFFCSPICQANFLKNVGMTSRSGFEWRELSQSIRQANPCVHCGTKVDLTVHHIIPERICVVLGIDPHDLDNLIPICRTHHMEFEPKWLLPEHVVGADQIGVTILRRLLLEALLPVMP